jgi:hypothetical protein
MRGSATACDGVVVASRSEGSGADTAVGEGVRLSAGAVTDGDGTTTPDEASQPAINAEMTSTIERRVQSAKCIVGLPERRSFIVAETSALPVLLLGVGRSGRCRLRIG